MLAIFIDRIFLVKKVDNGWATYIKTILWDNTVREISYSYGHLTYGLYQVKLKLLKQKQAMLDNSFLNKTKRQFSVSYFVT